MSTLKQLPEKFSSFASDALDDLEQCQQDPRYVVNMLHWHTPFEVTRVKFIASDNQTKAPEARCWVCLAGAYLAKHGELDPLRDVDSQLNANPFLRDNFWRISCLDDFRVGMIYSALCSYHDHDKTDDWLSGLSESDRKWVKTSHKVPAYNAVFPDIFISRMRQLVQRLADMGL